ncbi:Uncharacterised protein [Achromobacter sp. 2789STDY5608621]|nr:Uncharacterised protein [Achromobacter sp. 2789STDY5608621]
MPTNRLRLATALATPAPIRPSAGKPRLPNTSTQLPSTLNRIAPTATMKAQRACCSAATNERSTRNPRNGGMAQSRARRYWPAGAASSGGWRSNSRICSPYQSARQPGTDTSAAVHRPWRTVRRTSRTELRRAPSARAAIGAVALTRPSAKKAMAEYRLAPSALAASGCEPRWPMNMTSVTVIAIWARLVSTSGRLSSRVATISRFQAARRRAGMRLLL